MGRLDLMIESAREPSPPPREEVVQHQTKKKQEQRPTMTRSDNIIQDDDHVTDIYKDYDLYLSAKNGSLDDFGRILYRISSAEHAPFGVILRRLSPAGNTFLHIAAKHGNEDILTYIAAKDTSLMLNANSNGETALHIAAKAGNESMVKTLVLIHQDLLLLDEDDNLLRAQNERGNTALHEALINGRDSIAKHLIEKDPELSYYENNEGESLLGKLVKKIES